MIDETDDIHTCDWSKWRKPIGDLIGSCYEYRVCLICGAVDAAGEPEDPEDDEDAACEHRYCSPEIESGNLICEDCDAIVRKLTGEEMGTNHVT